MNKKGYLEARTILFIIILLFIGFMIWFSNIDFYLPGDHFCEDKGFHGVNREGVYDSYYGKVECKSCYKLNCTYQEFNATKKFGWVIEVKNE